MLHQKKGESPDFSGNLSGADCASTTALLTQSTLANGDTRFYVRCVKHVQRHHALMPKSGNEIFEENLGNFGLYRRAAQMLEHHRAERTSRRMEVLASFRVR